MFLASDHWSPRFENTFFTVKMEAFELQTSHPAGNEPLGVAQGKGTFPAYYYKIDVCCGHSKHSVLRRFSQFVWLVSKVQPDKPPDAPQLPPGTWICQSQNAAFARNRLEQLREFLQTFLQRPEVASHPVVAAFLELDKFAG